MTSEYLFLHKLTNQYYINIYDYIISENVSFEHQPSLMARIQSSRSLSLLASKYKIYCGTERPDSC